MSNSLKPGGAALTCLLLLVTSLVIGAGGVATAGSPQTRVATVPAGVGGSGILAYDGGLADLNGNFIDVPGLDEGDDGALRFSPDGSALAISVLAENATSVAVLRAGDEEPTVLMQNDLDDYTGLLDVVWSPDGRELALLTEDEEGERAQIRIMNATTGTTTTLLDEPSTWGDDESFSGLLMSGTTLAWGADGRIAFAAGRARTDGCATNVASEIWTVTEANPTPVRYGGSDADCGAAGSWILGMAWSPDQKTIAAVSTHSFDLYTPTKVTKEVRPTDSPVGQISDPAWSTDGTKVVWPEYAPSDAGPDTIVNRIYDRATDEVSVLAQPALPFSGGNAIVEDWQPCPTGTCVVWGDAPAGADLAVALSALAKASAGTMQKATLTVSNHGPVAAAPATVTLTAAGGFGLGYSAWSGTSGFAYTGGATDVALGDFVWKDLNGDGIQDPGEPGLPRVGLTVSRSDRKPVLTVSGAVQPVGALTVATDAAGHYAFAGLGPLPQGVRYVVTVLKSSLPTGLVATRSGAGGDPELDSSNSPASSSGGLLGGQSDMAIDLGFKASSGVPVARVAAAAPAATYPSPTAAPPGWSCGVITQAKLVCTIPALPSGAIAHITFGVWGSKKSAAGVVRASVTSRVADPVPANNTVTRKAGVTASPAKPTGAIPKVKGKASHRTAAPPKCGKKNTYSFLPETRERQPGGSYKTVGHACMLQKFKPKKVKLKLKLWKLKLKASADLGGVPWTAWAEADRVIQNGQGLSAGAAPIADSWSGTFWLAVVVGSKDNGKYVDHGLAYTGITRAKVSGWVQAGRTPYGKRKPYVLKAPDWAVSKGCTPRFKERTCWVGINFATTIPEENNPHDTTMWADLQLERGNLVGDLDDLHYRVRVP